MRRADGERREIKADLQQVEEGAARGKSKRKEKVDFVSDGDDPLVPLSLFGKMIPPSPLLLLLLRQLYRRLAFSRRDHRRVATVVGNLVDTSPRPSQRRGGG